MTTSFSGMPQTCNIGILGEIVPFLLVSNRGILSLSRGLIIEQTHYKTTNKDNSEVLVMECGCGRSPTGKCIGWHALTEEEYQNELNKLRSEDTEKHVGDKEE